MRHDIRFAGLAQEPERRLRLAARTLAVHGVDASVEPWQGSGCRLAVVGVDDAYGRHVFDIARRRNVPVIAIGNTEDVPESVTVLSDASIAALANALRTMLQVDDRMASRRGANGSAGARVVPIHNDAGLFSVLANDAGMRGRAVCASLGSRTVFLLPERGRVTARTMSDLMELRGRLAEAGWSASAISAETDLPADTEVSVSLDSWLVMGAAAAASRLPPFPDIACSLDHWPDLGSAPDAAQALRIAAVLTRGAHTCADVATITGIPAREVAASLWAFCAAGLSRESASTQQSPTLPALVRTGIWSRLAHRFGLG